MQLFNTLCVCYILGTYILMVTAIWGGAVTDPRKQPSQDTVIRCDDIQETTCKSMPKLIHQTMMAYKGCTRSSGSAQVTLHCCVPGVGSFDGCSSHLEQARNCTLTNGGGRLSHMVCEIEHDGQAVTTTWEQTTWSKNDVSSTPSTTQKQETPGSNSPSTKEDSDSNSVSAVTIGLIAGLCGAVLIAIIVVLVVFRVCREKREVSEDAEKTIPAGTVSKDWQAGVKSNIDGDTGDDGYMDIDALDLPKDKPQDTELDNVSMDGPYSTVKGPAMNGQVQKDAKPTDIVMVENDGYEGVGGHTLDDVIMVKNDDYEEFGEGNGASDGVVMVDNADYEGILSEGNGTADGLVMVENADYEGIPLGNGKADDIVMVEDDNYEGIQSG